MNIFDCDFQDVSFYNATFHQVDFQNDHFENGDFFQLKHQKLDLSSCQIDGLTINQDSLRNLVVNSYQALQFVKILGIEIKE